MEFNPADRRRLSAGGQAGETIVAAGRRWAAAAVRAARVAQALHRAAADLVAGAPPPAVASPEVFPGSFQRLWTLDWSHARSRPTQWPSH